VGCRQSKQVLRPLTVLTSSRSASPELIIVR